MKENSISLDNEEAELWDRTLSPEADNNFIENKEQVALLERYSTRAFRKVDVLIASIKDRVGDSIESEKKVKTAASITARALQSLSGYVRTVAGASIIAGALLMEPHSSRSSAETAERAELVKQKPRKTYSVEKVMQNGEEIYSHEVFLTNDTLNYLSGRSELPEYIKDGVLKEELAYRMFVSGETNFVRLTAKELEVMNLGELEKAYLSLNKVENDEDVQKKKLAELYKPMRYNAAVEQALWEIEQVCGNPKLILHANTPYYDAFVEGGPMPSAAEVVEYRNKNRSSFNYTTNTANIAFDYLDSESQRLRKLFGELSHAFQGQSDYAGTTIRALREDKKISIDAVASNKTFDAMYDAVTYSDDYLEADAHSRIQPNLEKLFARKINKAKM